MSVNCCGPKPNCAKKCQPKGCGPCPTACVPGGMVVAGAGNCNPQCPIVYKRCCGQAIPTACPTNYSTTKLCGTCGTGDLKRLGPATAAIPASSLFNGVINKIDVGVSAGSGTGVDEHCDVLLPCAGDIWDAMPTTLGDWANGDGAPRGNCDPEIPCGLSWDLTINWVKKCSNTKTYCQTGKVVSEHEDVLAAYGDEEFSESIHLDDNPDNIVSGSLTLRFVVASGPTRDCFVIRVVCLGKCEKCPT